MADFNVLFDNVQTMDVAFNEDAFSCDFGPGIVITDYDGPYQVTPDATEQILPTKYKSLDDNIVVGAVNLKPTALRPDAQLVQSYTFDKYAVADLELTIPAYTTSAKSLKATENLSPTISVDTATETVFIVERFLTIPEYSVTTKAKGRQEYTYCVYIYDLSRVVANRFNAMDGSKSVTSASLLFATMTSYRELYWSSASALTLYNTNAYGCYQTPTAPTLSSSVLTIKSPVLGVRGSTTYFTSTFMNALTDIRYQYVIDVYKAPKEALGIDGWISNEVVNHILDCVNSTTHKLT